MINILRPPNFTQILCSKFRVNFDIRLQSIVREDGRAVMACDSSLTLGLENSLLIGLSCVGSNPTPLIFAPSDPYIGAKAIVFGSLAKVLGCLFVFLA